MTITEDSDQVVQRRANLEELRKLGVDPYPHRFEPQASVEDIVQVHGAKSGEALDAEQVTTCTAGADLGDSQFRQGQLLGALGRQG